ncbi:hypothetical protein [Mycobacterium sp. MAA66]|uniref:hypothetical protein n=1 Tax=Mycobacterium sp. MAA66 TaxID=3156297 RepID=UPI00351154F5
MTDIAFDGIARTAQDETTPRRRTLIAAERVAESERVVGPLALPSSRDRGDDAPVDRREGADPYPSLADGVVTPELRRLADRSNGNE